MDKATSAVSSGHERKICEKIASVRISVISISHNTELKGFRHWFLAVDNEGIHLYTLPKPVMTVQDLSHFIGLKTFFW
jgi:ABC-type uncharacterized transport system fused permease/ATPase subunit